MDEPRNGLGRAGGALFEPGATTGEWSFDAPIGLVLSESTGRIVRVNRVFCDIVGRSETALVGLAHAHLLHPADGAAEDTALHELLTTRSARRRLEARYVRPDGEVRWVEITASLLRADQPPGPQGQPLVVRRVVDATHRRRIEAERDRFFEHSPAGIMVFGLDGRFKRVNPAVVRMLGWSEDELVGHSFMDFAHPDERALALGLTAQLAVDEGPAEYEARVRTRAGPYRWIRATVTAVRDEGLVYAWNIDIHEGKQAELLRRESEERFRRLFEESPAGGALVDPFLRLEKANSALSRILDRPVEALEGASLPELVHPEDAAVISRLTRSALEGAIPGYEVEIRLRRQDGSEVWVTIRASVVRNASGEALCVFQTIRDISELRERETARRDVDQLKDRFLAVVSHDLKNPLVTIGHLAELAQGEQCNLDLHREALTRILGQAAHLRQMVARYLDLERLYQGSVVATRRPTDIAAVVNRVVQHCDTRRHPVRVEVVPPLTAVDPDQFEHILENLLENATWHTPPDTPVLVRVEGTPTAIHIAVEDAGPGVPDGLKKSVFELFRTGGPTVARTGVGLWIVARYAELHGGAAWVEDRPGGGARFRVILPVSTAVETAGELDLRTRDESAGGDPTSSLSALGSTGEVA